MAIDKEIKDLLNEFGDKLLNDLRKSLKDKQRDRALISNLDRSIDPSTKFADGGLVLLCPLLVFQSVRL